MDQRGLSVEPEGHKSSEIRPHLNEVHEVLAGTMHILCYTHTHGWDELGEAGWLLCNLKHLAESATFERIGGAKDPEPKIPSQPSQAKAPKP